MAHTGSKVDLLTRMMEEARFGAISRGSCPREDFPVTCSWVPSCFTILDKMPSPAGLGEAEGELELGAGSWLFRGSREVGSCTAAFPLTPAFISSHPSSSSVPGTGAPRFLDLVPAGSLHRLTASHGLHFPLAFRGLTAFYDIPSLFAISVTLHA